MHPAESEIDSGNNLNLLCDIREIKGGIRHSAVEFQRNPHKSTVVSLFALKIKQQLQSNPPASRVKSSQVEMLIEFTTQSRE